MRKAIKNHDSAILSDHLTYVIGNSRNNSKISDILFKEQKGFCSYTDEFLSRTDASDIDHFDPTLKGTAQDTYDNWFLIKNLWNKEKSNKWAKYQPILAPATEDFERRVIYFDGDYITLEGDIEAENLVKLLNLNDPGLSNKRKKYIQRKREEIRVYAESEKTFFTTLLNADPCQISYLRAIKEEFKIDIWEILP